MIENKEVVSQDVQTPESQPEPQKAFELDGVSEFSFGGEKYTPDKFQEILSQYKTYGDQVQEYSENKKFEENFEFDLDRVLQDPKLLPQLEKVYPPFYVQIAHKILKSGQSSAQGQQASQPQGGIPKEMLPFIDDVKFLKSHVENTQVEAANAKIESFVMPLFKKYPLAVEEQVWSRAETMLAKNPKQGISDATWERLVRESHESFKKRADVFQNEQVKSQIEKGKQGKDVGPGGMTPGQAPKKAKNFDEAYEAMLKHVQSAG